MLGRSDPLGERPTDMKRGAIADCADLVVVPTWWLYRPGDWIACGLRGALYGNVAGGRPYPLRVFHIPRPVKILYGPGVW